MTPPAGPKARQGEGMKRDQLPFKCGMSAARRSLRAAEGGRSLRVGGPRGPKVFLFAQVFQYYGFRRDQSRGHMEAAVHLETTGHYEVTRHAKTVAISSQPARFFGAFPQILRAAPGSVPFPGGPRGFWRASPAG